MTAEKLRAPFPWFGGKSRAAHIVWERFGTVKNYVEPFFGSGAVLLGRPDFDPEARFIETVNDKDRFVANFWRAVSADPDAVAEWADWPVNECDLEARHGWLVATQADLAKKLEDPHFYDAKVAGWWVWGIGSWIGSGWCSGDGPHVHDGTQFVTDDNSNSVHRVGVSRKRPHIGDGGQGVHRFGVSRKLSHLGSGGQSLHRTTSSRREQILCLAERLSRVRVTCGDWSRVCGRSPTHKVGLTGVFLDPPYSVKDREHIYAEEDFSVAKDVREWAIANGDNPLMRICLAGYDDEHVMPDDWSKVNWKAHGGYGAGRGKQGQENAKRETLWFSPHCLNMEIEDV